MLVVTNPLKREHALIGKALEKDSPEIYERLKSLFCDTPQEIKFKKVPAYFLLYCEVYNISADANLNTPEDRRVFVGAMVRLLRTDLLRPSLIKVRVRSGFNKILYETLGVTERLMNYYIGQVAMWLRTDENFKARVSQVVEELTRED
jgi:hypothetical protein